MRRIAVAVLSTALLLGACTDDDPALDPDASPTDTPTADEETTDDGGTAAPDPTGTGEPTATEGEMAEGNDEDVPVSAELTGEAEVPGPGDEGGSGTFEGTIELLEASGELCYDLRASGLSSPVTAAHIHRGGPDVEGEVVVELEAPVEGEASGCAAIGAGDLVPLLEETADHYVNVHTESHPDGAVRGQLEQG